MNLQDQIQKLQADIDSAQANLAELRKQAAKPEPWAPAGGEWRLMAGLTTPEPCRPVFTIPPRFREDHIKAETACSEAGLRFDSLSSALAAAPHLRFFSRLLALARELNGSHGTSILPGSFTDDRYYVRFRPTNAPSGPGLPAGWAALRNNPGLLRPDAVFTSAGAAHKAAEIMNRDGWVPPGHVPTI